MINNLRPRCPRPGQSPLLGTSDQLEPGLLIWAVLDCGCAIRSKVNNAPLDPSGTRQEVSNDRDGRSARRLANSARLYFPASNPAAPPEDCELEGDLVIPDRDNDEETDRREER